MADDVVVERVRDVDDALVAAMNRLVPQLSATAPAVTEHALREVVTTPGTTLLVARVNGEVVGSVTVAVCHIPTGTRAWVEDVVVDDAARGAGVGEALVRAAVAEAHAAGARNVDLTSGPSREAAIRLYQRVGFRRRETSVFRYAAAADDGASPSGTGPA